MPGSGSSSVDLSSSSQISTDEQAIHVKMSHLVQEARVQSILQAQGIPAMIHFVYGFSDSPQVFGMHNYIAVASAKTKNPHCKILFHFMREPVGKWWQHAKVLLDEIIEHEGTTEFQGQCLTHYAHKADVVRLKAIYERGGIYMDIDTISLRSWAPLQAGNQFVMAEQDSPSSVTVRQGKVYGLCNAGMASVKGSLFAALWLESYQFFRSHGRDGFWDEHSVILPANLTDEYPWLVQEGHVTILPAKSMWIPLWNHVDKALLQPNTKNLSDMFSQSILIHLWDSSGHRSFKELETINPSWLDETPYGREARQYVRLSNDFVLTYTPL
eukprot:CAMPEP_0174578032 /NCGR_PEP_ID=MMETSP0929-20130131/449_1 /TAXON_ID=548131 ORGANISM="Ostreococcus mediterraneus, Strain clade-D-RCC2572" /NCGR_SAMPLE_ID=MMETSP0929 /ASSEMBLY_ACC=CAM_ASM_000573 /LENGTH=326 /DNA_ID=CAMNT_0015758993 /DNA_START=593 /DNA_END=1573 /DNA_ORIENTATION=-